jgi:hypothetical protein
LTGVHQNGFSGLFRWPFAFLLPGFSGFSCGFIRLWARFPQVFKPG